ncbi:tetratricopeptide repeat protein [Longimicrobium sp.]|jgi:tetratricopeptide (TPR) repeat protein|uniref:tetratricopeptide repeat protein n=1 Tax=Longimicrobium sp. TaxID=2029185 RepID=UPI002EDB0231
MARRSRTTSLAAAAVALFIAIPAAAQDHAHAAHASGIGKVEFPTSCAPPAQAHFERGVAMLHSFWFDAAEREFQQAAAADAQCPMPHWGTAMTLLGNLFTAIQPSPANLARGLEAAQRATELAAGATHREQMYARAALALYADHQATPFRARLLAHEAAMRSLNQAHPEDEEAAIFLARAFIANAPLTDLQYTKQLEAAAILEPLLRARPDHPGLAHYTIHAFDAPPIAQRALDAARRYAGVAPDAPHALHMPSHIFTRLGYWDESIETNRRSAAAEPDSNAAVHPMDYLVYAYLQQGRDREAARVVERAVQNPDRFYGAGITSYNFSAMQARLALERGRWMEAAQLAVPASAPAYVRAIRLFARGIGAARSGVPGDAAASVGALAVLADSLTAAGESYWATAVGAQRLAAEAWIAHASGDRDRALQLARQAAELEETVEKHPVMPGPLLPARELQADLLLEVGRPADALAAYRETLRREPNRARALYGAARAAQAAGEGDAAADYYRQLLALMAKADPDRPEVAAARAFVARR